jgi:hypothetical protein
LGRLQSRDAVGTIIGGSTLVASIRGGVGSAYRCANKLMASAPDEFNLPRDLVDFLRAGKQLEYDPSACDPGRVVLNSLNDLRLIEVWVDSEETPFEPCDPPGEDDVYEYWPDLWDPNNCGGSYVVGAVPLVQRSDPERWWDDGILLWYPCYEEYGQWDSEHRNAIRFGKAVAWPDIVHDPAHFLNAKWAWDEEDPIFNWVTPWLDEAFDFRENELPEVIRFDDAPSATVRPNRYGWVQCPACGTRSLSLSSSWDGICGCGQRIDVDSQD